MLSTASQASFWFAATTTPFPAAKPLALITSAGKSALKNYEHYMFAKKKTESFMLYVLMKFLAAEASVKDFQRAVGMLWRSMKALAQSLLDSITAAFFSGPKTWIPFLDKTSAMPLARGSSGPTTTRSMVLLLHHFATAFKLRSLFLIIKTLLRKI